MTPQPHSSANRHSWRIACSCFIFPWPSCVIGSIRLPAHARGAHVTLISGPTAIQPPKGVEFVRIGTTQELYDTVLGHADADVVIQAAAPADYRAREISRLKSKRTGDSLMIELVPNPDITAALGAPQQTLVGFAAETNNVIENAQGRPNASRST